MISKLRIKLTAICTLITGAILIITLVITFFLNKSQLNERSKYDLVSNLNSLVYHLQNSYSNSVHFSMLSRSWLAQMENSNALIIHIEDNHQPLLFQGDYITGSTRTKLIELAKNQAQEHYGFNFYLYSGSNGIFHHITFELKPNLREHFLVGVASISIQNSNYQLILLKDMNEDDKQIREQLLLYICFSALGIILLSLFSFGFAKRAVLPIEESNRKQKEFIASASHELRSPIAVVKTSLSALTTEYPAIADSTFYYAIGHECKRMTSLISDLLLLSHADTNTHWNLDLKWIEPDTLVLECYDTFYHIAQEKEHTLTLNLSEEPIVPCLLDAERITQVLAILIDNALCYTPIGTNITLNLYLQAQCLCIAVCDEGPGIPDDYKTHVFERFYRIDSSRHKKEHSGLGLSIAYEIVTLHGGKLTLTDTLPHGCSFTIILPIKHS